MRFAKILGFVGRRTDVGIDLYNLFNSNVTTAYQQTYEYATNGAAWLRPTAIISPRLARFIPSLREYVIVAQDDVAIEVRSRDDAGGWRSRVFQRGEQARLATRMRWLTP